MLPKATYTDWEKLVEKQLKTEDIYTVLEKPNLEEINIRPLYEPQGKVYSKLPKIEESTHLVSDYSEHLDENVFAVLLDFNVENLEGKTIFIHNKNLTEHLSPKVENRYYNLIDPFNEKEGTLNEQLVKELLSKDFERNLTVDIAFHQNSGASLVQQLGIALSKAKELFEVFDFEIAEKLMFKIAIGGNYFFEIAKIRALKLLFSQLSKEYGKEMIPYIFAETSLRNKTVQDEENNLIRSTLELAAAMIGGADAVYSNNYKLKNPSELSSEISFKQQIVLAYESIVNVFEDGAEGSYYIEDVTRQIAEKAWTFFLETEENGGYLQQLKDGIIQKKIYEQAVAEQKWVEDGRIKLIGVNLYPKLETTKTAEEMYSEKEIKPVRWAEMFE